MAPGGQLFCMSGPVGHADDEDDDHSGYLHIQPLFLGIKKGSGSLQDFNDKEEFDNDRFSDVEFSTDRYSECCVKFQCPDSTCKMLWLSGASYKGEFLDGNLHGVGTYTGADGTLYDGNWILNKKHGFGRKKYVNGDVYEGSWKWDMPEGQGRYLWSNDSEYCGEWRQGIMSGVGVITRADGDRYDGQWLNGLADGHGVYTWADGSVYMGTWKEGSKVGPGRYFSPGRKSVDAASIPSTSISFQTTAVVRDLPIDGLKESGPDSKSIAAAEEDRNTCPVCLKESTTLQELMSVNVVAQTHTLTADIATCSAENEQESRLILERLQRLEIARGLLKFEEGIDADKLLDRTRSSASDFDLLSIIEEERPGEVVGKSHRSYNLVTALQLGIRYSVLEGSLIIQDKEFSPGDFGLKSTVKVKLPKESSQCTALLDIADFQWTDYCPAIFRRLREISKVVATSYCQSICGTAGLRELPSSGKSGCLFYISQDDRFMIKALRKAEVKTFLSMLTRYCKHIYTHENTFLTKFFGLHGVKLAGGQEVHFVVMGNDIASHFPINKIYDLKGSSEGRITTKSEKAEFAPMKDLDLDVVLQVDPSSRQIILRQIDKDCEFLESERIMDYSLLLGLQFVDSKHDSSCSEEQCSKIDRPPHKLVEAIFPAESESFDEPEERDFILHRNTSRRISLERLGLAHESYIDHLDPIEAKKGLRQYSAKMFHKTCQGSLQADCVDGQEVVLYFGIIDILQNYDLSKKLEHAYKSLYVDPLTISAVDPAFYSKRFQQLMHQIFVEIPEATDL